MVSAPDLVTQASPTLAKTRTPLMRPRLIAPRMERLLHPDLYRSLGSLGSLSLVWPLPPLPPYDRLVPSFVAGDYVKGVQCRFLTVPQLVTHRHLLEFGVLVSHTTARSISFLTTLILFNVLILCLYAGGRALVMCRIANRAAVLSVRVQSPSPFHM